MVLSSGSERFLMKLLYVTRDQVAGKVGLLPIGSLEQHGPHLPMGTDSIIAEWVAQSVEAKFPELVLLFPTLCYGCSLEHTGFPYVGANYISMINFLLDLLESSFKSGLKAVILVNAHGGNESVLDLIVRQHNFTRQGKVYLFSLLERRAIKLNDLHAGTVESSEIKLLAPWALKEEKVNEVKDYSVKSGVFRTVTVKEANPYGVLNPDGPLIIDQEIGKRELEAAVAELSDLVIKVSGQSA